MKILVVGYACNPCGGSEPGVGWAAVRRIARDHDVWVLTDIHNKTGWESGGRNGQVPANVQVRFLRDHSDCSSNRLLAHIQSWRNYADFNRRVLAAADAWHKEIGFDLCHQVTIASWRMPSPLWRLPIPFVWGPIGGAGYIPPAFRSMLSPSARMFEVARDLSTRMTLGNRGFKDCMHGAAVVFAANEETEMLLRPHRHGKPLVRLPIVSISTEKAETFHRKDDVDPYVPAACASSPLRLFAGGNMEGRKGVSLALRALAIVAESGVDFTYTVAGGGPEIPSLRKLSTALGLDDKVIFHPGFSGDDYLNELQKTDVYFLPSFRESTPVTLIEAYLAGCFPVVADTSAQGEIVRMAGGMAVPVNGMAQLIDGLSRAIHWCAGNRESLPGLAAEARLKVIRHFDGSRYDRALVDAYAVAMNTR